MGTTLSILAGVGGSLGGGALAAEGSEAGRPELGKIRSSGLLVTQPNFLQDPILASIFSQQLASLGIVQPDILMNAGPINQLLNTARVSGRFNLSQFRRAENRLREALELIRSGVPEESQEIQRLFRPGQSGGVEKILAESGFTSLGELLQAEQQFQQQIEPVLANLEGFRESGLERSQIINDALLTLTQQAAGRSDLDALRQGERDRLQREIEERRREALQAGNVGGFNPSGTLEALADTETDADLIALQRALALAQGEAGLANNTLALLTGLNPASVTPPAVFQPSNTTLAPAGGGGGGGNAALGSAVANAGLLLGTGLQENREGINSAIRGLFSTGNTSPGTP